MTSQEKSKRTDRRLSFTHWRTNFAFGNTELIVFAALVVLFFATGLMRPEALSIGNAENIIVAAIPLMILAAGQLLVIATAGIDLSVGAVFSLVGMVTAALLAGGQSAPIAIGVGMLTGGIIGLFNGFCVAVLKLAPFVVTLVTMSVAASQAYIVTGGNSVPLDSAGLNNVYYGLTLGIPNYFFIPILLIVVIQLFLSLFVAGRWVFAVGSNKQAAELVGVPVRLVTVGAYTISSLCAALASILQLSYLSNAEVTSGTGLELLAIAAVVIGGASLFGGRGSAIGALLGALIITAIRNAVNLLGINTFWQGTVTGAVILIAVLADRITAALNALREAKAAQEEKQAAAKPMNHS